MGLLTRCLLAWWRAVLGAKFVVAAQQPRAQHVDLGPHLNWPAQQRCAGDEDGTCGLDHKTEGSKGGRGGQGPQN